MQSVDGLRKVSNLYKIDERCDHVKFFRSEVVGVKSSKSCEAPLAQDMHGYQTVFA